MSKDLKSIKKKYSKIDSVEMWDLSYTTAVFLIPRLKYYRKHKQSYPDKDGNGNEITLRKWNGILTTMINTFEVIEDEEKYYKRFKSWKGWGKTATKESIKLMKKRLKYIDKGLKLFAEYYLTLWD